MSKRLLTVLLLVSMISSLAVLGCKGRAQKAQEEATMENAGVTPQEEPTTVSLSEPAQTIATEQIPPTAAPAIAPAAISTTVADRGKDIQLALKNAGFYSGSIDGKIGPRTKKAIEDFQRAKGLKVDGKVGPRTWAELEKYLTQQLQ